MLQQEKYFDERFEYIDLWAAGYVKAQLPNLKFDDHTKTKTQLIETFLNRIEVINSLRTEMGLLPLNLNETYDYYINNLIEFNDFKNEIEFDSYNEKTNKITAFAKSLRKPAGAEAYLIVIGAPDIYIQNHHILQERIDIVNRMLKEAGYSLMTPQKTEELLLRILLVHN